MGEENIMFQMVDLLTRENLITPDEKAKLRNLIRKGQR